MERLSQRSRLNEEIILEPRENRGRVELVTYLG
jgi:hypothetical protein